MRWRIPLLGLVLLLVGGELSAQDACPVQGIWKLESQAFNGEARDVSEFKQIMVVTSSHSAWMRVPNGADTTVVPALYTGSRRSVTGNTVTETLEYSKQSEYVGLESSYPIPCPKGDLLYSEFDLPITEDGEVKFTVHLEEVWRRIE